MVSQSIFTDVTELTVEISSPEPRAKATARTSQDLRKLFQRALEDKKGQSSVKVSLPDMRYIGPVGAQDPDDSFVFRT